MRAYCTIALAASRSTDGNAKPLKTHGYAAAKRGELNFIHRQKTTRQERERARGEGRGGKERRIKFRKKARENDRNVVELRGWNERAAHCTRKSRERVGSLNSLVHSRALRFGFPVCMRACPSVRPSVPCHVVSVSVFTTRAFVCVCVYVYASLQLQSREEEGRVQKKKKEKRNGGKGEKRTTRARPRECERTRKRGDKNKGEGGER